jgi:ketosteroid isomerase-like protein
MNTDSSEELLRVARAWDQAMVANDPEAIGSFMAEDWKIIGPDGSVGDRETFLALVRSGDLMHDVMTTEDADIRIYGSVAVVIARGVSAGSYRGQRFHETERSSCVFVKQAGSWRCVLTHLSRLAQGSPR